MGSKAVVAGLVAAAATGLSIGAAQVPPASASRTVVTVRLRVSGTSTVAPSGWWAESVEHLRAGESGRVSVNAGKIGAQSLCGGIGAGASSSDAAHAWTADIVLISASIDRIGVRVSWRRFDGGAAVAGDTRELVLAEQTRYPLDFLSVSEPDRGGCGAASASVEISADVAEPASLAETILDYEIWRVHEDGRGGRWSERTLASARQGEQAEFWFTPVTWPLPSGCDVAVKVSGEIRGRLRDDGTIEMAVSPSRRLEHTVPAIRFPDRRAGSETGKKVVDVGPGQSVRFVLPSATGSSGLPCGDPQAPALRVDWAALLANHQTSIIVRPSVRRQ
jgi:hypothetical protein